jgi:hypothetical protein
MGTLDSSNYLFAWLEDYSEYLILFNISRADAFTFGSFEVFIVFIIYYSYFYKSDISTFLSETTGIP